MDLQLIVSSASEAPDLMDPIFETYKKVSKIPATVTTEDDIDAVMLGVVTQSHSGSIFNGLLSNTNIEAMIAHGNIVKPFLDYKDSDFFI